MVGAAIIGGAVLAMTGASPWEMVLSRLAAKLLGMSLVLPAILFLGLATRADIMRPRRLEAVGALALSYLHQPTRSLAQPPPDLSPEWGAWPELEIGMPLVEAEAIVKRRVGAPLTSRGSTGDTRRYTVKYAHAGVDIQEAVDVSAETGLVKEFRFESSSWMPCYNLIELLHENYGKPKPYKGGIEFGATNHPRLVWDAFEGEQIILRMDDGSEFKSCDQLTTVAPYRKRRDVSALSSQLSDRCQKRLDRRVSGASDGGGH